MDTKPEILELAIGQTVYYHDGVMQEYVCSELIAVDEELQLVRLLPFPGCTLIRTFLILPADEILTEDDFA